MEARPFRDTPVHTEDLPATPQRTYRIPASAWIEAPAEVRELGDTIDEPVEYKRRIGRFLLWRAGPPVGESRYLAIADDLSASFSFDLNGRTGWGRGADGREHTRLRTWKESLRDAS
jgi:hypothetical protein